MMPKQYMSLRNKQYRGPIRPHVASPRKIVHARLRGYNAWALHGKSINDNPYKGSEAIAWREGYLEASKFKMNLVASRAPEGRDAHKDSYVVVKRFGAEKKLKGPAEPRERETETYLGYIKPGKDGRLKRFYPWSNNPPEDVWRNKIANKSYKEEKEGDE
jgi:hypothetical protein